MGTSVDDGMRKSNNWLDQWQNWAPEVEFSPFHALSCRQLTFPFCCYISLIYSCHDMESEESDLSGRYKTQGTTASYSTGHCATVNKQHSKCLLALITIHKIEIYLKGKLLTSVIYNKAVTCTCDQWPVTHVQPANAYFEQVQHTMWVFTPKYCYSIFQ